MGAKMVTGRILDGVQHVRCPVCTVEQPLPKDEFDIDAQGLVHPDFVCTYMDQNTECYCRFAGPIRLKA